MAFLTEVIDFYQNINNEEQKMEIFNRFLKMLWNSKCKYRKYNKHIRFNLKGGVLQNPRLCEVFEKYKDIQYPVVQSIYKNTSLESIDYIKIHINNLYAYNFDKDVYYNKDYYTLLYKAKKEYYNTLEHIKEVDVDKLEEKLKDTYNKANEIKEKCMSKKYDVNWNDYKEYINKCLRKTFDNYISIEQLQEDEVWEDKFTGANWDEDNHVISYICNCLTGCVRDYIKNISQFNTKYKWKNNLKQYIKIENVLKDYSVLQLCVSKYFNNKEDLLQINNEHFYKLTRRQKEVVKFINESIYAYKEKNIILLNEFGLPRFNEVQLSKIINKPQRSLNVMLDSIYHSIRKSNEYKYCINCGKQIKTKSNKTKYCPKCAKEMQLKKYKKYNKKRSKIKNNHQ